MKTLQRISLLFFTVMIWVTIRQYLFCPQFAFTKGKPFSGNHFYNPYSGIGSGFWIKCNFHAHTNAWNGLTNGHGTAADVWRSYDSLGYTVHCVSDYQKINSDFNAKINYLPAYEHGYNFKKTHELVLGDHKVTWLEYILPQSLSNKQWILDNLAGNGNNLIALNHPAIRNGFNESDLIYLNKYDCIEVLNPYGCSISYWDAALSAGKPVFIMGNDDAHHVEKIASIGKDCTWVNIDALNCKSIVNALKIGRSYGMHIGDVPCETVANRIKRLRYDLPRLKEFSVTHDTIQMAVTQKAVEIQFTGQEGKILSTTCQASQARYVIKPGDRYVRATISFADGTEIFLSPVFRYSVSPFAETSGPVINRTKTILYFLTGLLILSVWTLIVANSLFGNLVRRIRLAQKRRPSYPAVG